MKKNLLVILGISIPFGILLSVLKNRLNIPEKQFWTYYAIFAVALAIGAYIINFIWQLSFLKKLMKISSLLYNDNNPDGYIEENEKLLKRVKSSYNRGRILMNISVGYCEKQDYRRAKEILLDIPEKHMKGIHKVLYYHNLCYYYFMLNENKQAAAIFSSNYALFQKYENNPSFGGCILVNRIHYHLSNGEIEQAKILREEAKKKYTDPKYQHDFEALDQKLINHATS